MQPRASKRPVVLIVENETLVRMDAIEVIEAAGFDSSKQAMRMKLFRSLSSDKRHSLDIHQHPDAGIDGWTQACPFREGPLAADQDHCNFRPYKNHGERLARGQPLSAQTVHGTGDRERD
jgi:hypothetical protein